MVEAGRVTLYRPRLVRRRRADRAGSRSASTAPGSRPSWTAERAGLPGAAGVASGTRKPGEHELSCRATDANGETQPLRAALGRRRLRQQRRAARARHGEIGAWHEHDRGFALARQGGRPLPDLRRAAAREPDRARRGDLGAAPRRPDARLPLRLPRRHVRQLRHDGQRPPALDLPHAHLEGGGGRPLEIGPLANLPVIKDLACDMAAFFEKWQKAKGVFAPSKSRADADREDLAGDRAAHRRRCGHRVHQLRACAIRPATRCAGTRTIWARPRSTAPGRSSTTCAMPATRERLAAVAARRRLPRLPLAPELPGALPQGAQPHRLHRRPQAPHHAGLHPGRAVTDATLSSRNFA